MIGKLKGIVDTVNDDNCVLDVNGVGYLIYCPTRILLGLQTGSNRSLVTHLLVKEDQLTLFGFNDEQEKSCFLNLQTVQGVGAKMALAILNMLTPDKITLALIAEDTAAFKQVSGVGAKLASRIINELKNKSHLFTEFSANQNHTNLDNASKSDKSLVSDAISALINLGFSKSDAFPIVNQLYVANENIGFDELIRCSLSKLSKQ